MLPGEGALLYISTQKFFQRIFQYDTLRIQRKVSQHRTKHLGAIEYETLLLAYSWQFFATPCMR